MRAWVLGLALVALVPLAQAAAHDVLLGSGFFDPTSVSVGRGEPVRFVNVDDRAHTVTSDWDGGKAVNLVLLPGQSVSVTFQQPGTYPIRCVPHSTHDATGMHGMVARVQVVGADPMLHTMATVFLVVGSAGAVIVGVAKWRMRPRPGRSPWAPPPPARATRRRRSRAARSPR